MVDDEIFVCILNDRLHRIKVFHLIPIYISLSYKIICFTSNSINVMTFLQIVPGSIIASLSNYHRIYLICRIHAIHKLPMLKTIESAYLPQYPLVLHRSNKFARSINRLPFRALLNPDHLCIWSMVRTSALRWYKRSCAIPPEIGPNLFGPISSATFLFTPSQRRVSS